MTGYDIIGDVHGCADLLLGLLAQLGYHEKGGALRHPERRAIFVGDLVDRGPQQVRTLEIIRAMVEDGHAQVVMGNHEFNAISFATPNPEIPGEFVRRHSDRNHRQHHEFLQQVQVQPNLHARTIEWFRTFPLWLDLPGLRVVHACWNDAALAAVATLPSPGTLMTDDFVFRASQKGSPEHRAIEVLLKGPEMSLSEHGLPGFLDKDGHERHEARVRWWNSAGQTVRDMAEIPPDATTKDGAPYPKLPKTACAEATTYAYNGDKPVFFGHYWRTGVPVVAGPRAVCVDYSAVKAGGSLVAYRWGGEEHPQDSNFVVFGGD